MAESTKAWPKGVRFKPTEDELVGHHLTKKLKGETETICVIPELNIYDWEPQELFTRYNELSGIPSDGRECFFFCPPSRKRKIQCGFWKETSTKRSVQAPDTGEEIGLRRSFVYHKGRQRDAHRTSLSMLEYHLNPNVSDSKIPDPTALVLCHIINREGKKAKLATASTPAVSSGISNLNDSYNEETQEISAQASPGVTVEFPYPKEMLNVDLPDQSMPIPDQQPHMSKEQSLFYDDHQHVDGPNDEPWCLPYSPSNCIDLADLFSFDESADEHAKLE